MYVYVYYSEFFFQSSVYVYVYDNLVTKFELQA